MKIIDINTLIRELGIRGGYLEADGTPVNLSKEQLVFINKKINEKEQEILQKQQKEELKRTGIAYTEGGDKIPFTNEDAIAMVQVKLAFELGITNTNIKFSNGTILPMTANEFPAFAVWFAQQRNSFFI